MAAPFADLPVALANAGEIFKRCNLLLSWANPCCPSTRHPRSTVCAYARTTFAMPFEGLEERLVHLYPSAVVRDASARIRRPAI
jgi:DNA polymerase-3 subunit alpha